MDSCRAAVSATAVVDLHVVGVICLCTIGECNRYAANKIDCTGKEHIFFIVSENKVQNNRKSLVIFFFQFVGRAKKNAVIRGTRLL